MNFLFLCNKLPYPPVEGGSMAMNMLIEGVLQSGHQVKVLAFSTNKNPHNPSEVPPDYLNKTGLETIFIDLAPKFFPALLCFLSRKSYHVKRFISGDFKEKLVQVLENQKFDIIQLESIFLTPYLKTIRKYSDAKIILRSHNVEHLIWKRLSKNAKNPVKKFYFNHLSKRLKAYEKKHLIQFNGIACISKTDAIYYKSINKKHLPVVVTPYGINLKKYPLTTKREEQPSLFFLGAMNWLPNAEGVRWFLENIWPAVHKNFPHLKFYIAGKGMPGWMKKFISNEIQLIGHIENAKDFITSKSIMIVPLLSGSGIRVKIIEGMALGKAIISTTIGAEGIDYENGKNILIANQKNEFIIQIGRCLEEENFIQKLGVNARSKVVAKYRSDKIITDLINFYQRILK